VRGATELADLDVDAGEHWISVSNECLKAQGLIGMAAKMIRHGARVNQSNVRQPLLNATKLVRHRTDWDEFGVVRAGNGHGERERAVRRHRNAGAHLGCASIFTDMIESRLRVLTWNIWWRFGPWKPRQTAILHSMEALSPDIIALQEVWGDDAKNFADIAARFLGCQHAYAPAMCMGGLRSGNALLSRWPILKQDHTMLFGKEETGEGRLALFAEVDGPRGRIPVFSTHLNWKFGHSNIRQRQVADLAHFVDRKRPWTYPPIVCGDFNAEPGSDEIRMLTGLTACPVDGLVFHDAWAVAGGEGSGKTWDNRNPYAAAEFEPDRRLDYIFVGLPGRGGAGHVVDCRLAGDKPVDGIWPSDHCAVMAELRY